MGRDSGEGEGGKVGMRRSAERKRVFASSTRSRDAAVAINADARERRSESGKEAKRATGKMLDVLKKDESANFEGVARYLDWLKSSLFDDDEFNKWLKKRPEDRTKLENEDWKILLMSASDLEVKTRLPRLHAGGQNAQKNEGAVDITHKPTRIVASREKKGQVENKADATNDLLMKLAEHVCDVKGALKDGEDLKKGVVRIFRKAISDEYLLLDVKERMRLEGVMGKFIDEKN